MAKISPDARVNPGSSIMPGKVNPTQQEAMVMVCLQVIGGPWRDLGRFEPARAREGS